MMYFGKAKSQILNRKSTIENRSAAKLDEVNLLSNIEHRKSKIS